jgi:CXXX repeat modification system protein
MSAVPLEMRSAPGEEPRRVVGSITKEERDEIRAIFERKNGLNELFRSLASLSAAELEATPLYERIVRDMGDASRRFQAWWDSRSAAYHWESLPGYQWEVDFEGCTIYLKKK